MDFEDSTEDTNIGNVGEQQQVPTSQGGRPPPIVLTIKVNSLAVGFFFERSFSVYYQTVSEVTAIQKYSW
jgi:hypothetical protein